MQGNGKVLKEFSKNHIPPLSDAWQVNLRWRSAAAASSDPSCRPRRCAPGRPGRPSARPGAPATSTPAAYSRGAERSAADSPCRRGPHRVSGKGLPRQEGRAGRQRAIQPSQPPVTPARRATSVSQCGQRATADVSTYLRHRPLDNSVGPGWTAAPLRRPLRPGPAPPPRRPLPGPKALQRGARGGVRVPAGPRVLRPRPGTRAGGCARDSWSPHGKRVAACAPPKGMRSSTLGAERGPENAEVALEPQPTPQKALVRLRTVASPREKTGGAKRAREVVVEPAKET